MRSRHLPRPLPWLWLMTDERMEDRLWPALERLPRGSGIVFRHHATPTAERRRLFARVAQVARRRRLVLVRAGRQAMRGEGGTHNQTRRPRGLRTYSVHDVPEAVAARRAGADLVFVSPVFPTRSHPAARTLEVVRLGLLVRALRVPTVALGGMNARAFRRLRGLRLWGWAGIDAWTGFDGGVAKPRRQPLLREAAPLVRATRFSFG